MLENVLKSKSFTFFLITGHTINITRENKSVFKLRIITAIIIFIIMSVPTNYHSR